VYQRIKNFVFSGKNMSFFFAIFACNFNNEKQKIKIGKQDTLS